MKLFSMFQLGLAFLAWGLSSSFAFAQEPVGQCKLTVSNDPSYLQEWSLYDQQGLHYSTPILIEYRDIKGQQQLVQLGFAFGSKDRVLLAEWAENKSFTPIGQTYSIRPIVSKLKTRLSPGQAIEFEYGSEDYSPHPTIQLSCEIFKDAKPFESGDSGCEDCESGGSSVSN